VTAQAVRVTPHISGQSGQRRGTWPAIGGLIVLGTLVRLQQLSHSLNESYAFRQTQTALVVREYAEHGIDLFRSPLPIFGANADVPLEFPLFQAVAALFTRAGLSVDTAVRLTGLLSFEASAALFAVLLLRWHGRAVAVVGVTLFQFLPFGLQWGAASLIDFFAVALALLMLVGLDKWFRGGSAWWLATGAVGAVLGFLVKITTLPVWGPLLLVSALLVLSEKGWHRSWRRLSAGLMLGPGLGLLLALAWTAYADSVKRGHELTEFLLSSNLNAWNFGTMAQRVDTQTYATILNRISAEIAGPALVSLLLAVVAMIFTSDRRIRWTTAGWLATAVVGPLVFINLYFVHSYYLIGVYPAVIALIAIGGVWLIRLLPAMNWQRIAVGALGLGVLLGATATTETGRYDIERFAHTTPIPYLSQQILDETDPESQLVVIGCDWDPVTLYYAERTGVMLLAPSATYWESHDIQGYDYLARCNDAADPAAYLPSGSVAIPILTTEIPGTPPHLFRIAADRGTS
jgi:hypothetical protein